MLYEMPVLRAAIPTADVAVPTASIARPVVCQRSEVNRANRPSCCVESFDFFDASSLALPRPSVAFVA